MLDMLKMNGKNTGNGRTIINAVLGYLMFDLIYMDKSRRGHLD